MEFEIDDHTRRHFAFRSKNLPKYNNTKIIIDVYNWKCTFLFGLPITKHQSLQKKDNSKNLKPHRDSNNKIELIFKATLPAYINYDAFSLT